MKAVLERVHTRMWSTFCGLVCTLSTAGSVPASACGGRKDVKQSQDLASQTLTVLSLDPVITYTYMFIDHTYKKDKEFACMMKLLDWVRAAHAADCLSVGQEQQNNAQQSVHMS